MPTYSNFTARLQPQTVLFRRSGNNSVRTTYTYNAQTGRVATILTQKLVNGTPTLTYQTLAYAFDPKGNLLTLTDTVNSITQSRE